MTDKELKEIRDKNAFKYGDERGGTTTTKQGSYAYTDYLAGFDCAIELMRKENEDLKSELDALNKVYYMNREYIEIVKARLTNQGYLTELDIKNDIEKYRGKK